MKKTGQLPQRNLIGNRVRKARLACRPPVTQQDLAGRLAAREITIDQTGISRIENQTRYLMDYEIIALAKALKVSVAYRFGESSKPRGD